MLRFPERHAPAGRLTHVLLLVTTFALGALAAPAASVTLHPGDVIVLAREYTTTPGILLHVNVGTAVMDTIAPVPPLPSPQDLAVRVDGTLLVADAALGLVAVDAGSGAATVLAGPAAFGGTAPTTLAFTPGGDLLLAGPSGVSRVPAGQSAPQSVSGPGMLLNPRGIAGDGGANIWVCDQGVNYPVGGDIVHVNAGGVQSLQSAGCATNQFPVLPNAIRLGPDGYLYVVSAPFSGPTNYLNGGVFRMDPATGVATMWRQAHFIRGFELTPDGSPWLLVGNDISHDPYDGILGGPGGTFWPGARGPIALVPAAYATPARASTWGALKSRYR